MKLFGQVKWGRAYLFLVLFARANGLGHLLHDEPVMETGRNKAGIYLEEQTKATPCAARYQSRDYVEQYH